MNFNKMTIKEVKNYIDSLEKIDDKLIESLNKDHRSGIKKLVDKILRDRKKSKDLVKKWKKQNKKIESLVDKGYHMIAGIDEAGRGPLAGPVVSSAVILDSKTPILGLTDSKKINLKKREKLFEVINDKAIAIGIGIVSNTIIDRVNIQQATFIAMRRAVLDLKIEPDYLLVDGNQVIPEIEIDQKAVIKGDLKINSVSAASIIAKVTRDQIMDELDKTYPQYKFISNKGYGTKEHINVIKEIGPSPCHRYSYKIVAENKKGVKDEY